jgi:hypothetical protein
MADSESIRESKRRYDARRPPVFLRLDGEVAGAVVVASTESGMSRARWLEQAVLEKLAREQVEE